MLNCRTLFITYAMKGNTMFHVNNALRNVNILRYRYPTDTVQAIKKAMPQRRFGSRAKRQPPIKENTAEEKLIYTTTAAQDTLLRATTVFPFVLFPDTIQLDREKLTITHKSFFRTSDIISIQIGDILNVQGNMGPFFGNLVVSTKYFNHNTQTINYLRRRDVLEFQRLIQGSIIAYHRGIDCSNIECTQLVALLTDLGQGAGS